MGRTAWGNWSLSYKPPGYEVDDNGKIIGYVYDRQPNNWGRWGDLDERGTTDLITPERIQEAKNLITVIIWARFARVVRGEVLGVRARDFVSLARGMGCSAERVTAAEHLREALAKALRSPVATLVEVAVA